jgi:hypothetical protein
LLSQSFILGTQPADFLFQHNHPLQHVQNYLLTLVVCAVSLQAQFDGTVSRSASISLRLTNKVAFHGGFATP